MREVVAVVGLGHMGHSMARRLLQSGFTLRVWNRTRSRAQGLDGAQVCDTPRQAAEGAQVVLSSLADDAAVRGVTFGEDGILAGLGSNAIHVGTSTISRALSAELADAHRQRGRRFVAAPVLGRPDAAARGELWILAGGPAESLERLAPMFAAIGRGTITLGDAPRASLAKIICNFMLAGTIELLGEATALGDKGGIPPRDLVHLLTETLFGAPAIRSYGERIAERNWAPAAFAIGLGLKDVLLALASGAELRVPLPTANIARDHMLELIARGHDDFDWTGLAAAPRAAAGLDPI